MGCNCCKRSRDIKPNNGDGNQKQRSATYDNENFEKESIGPTEEAVSPQVTKILDQEKRKIEVEVSPQVTKILDQEKRKIEVEVSPQVTKIFGREERTLETRRVHTSNANTMQRPKPTPGTPWTDARFELVVKPYKNRKLGKISWRRPQDYTGNATLFGDVVNRFSVKQGQVGDCFFMATLSGIADQKGFLEQIMPPDAYVTAPGSYTGVFHCRLWWMGEWIDVYADDQVPYNDDISRVHGGHSDDKNIVWVTLMEKAMARFCGSYEAVSGNVMDAYKLLTGGLVEELKIIKRNEDGKLLPPESSFRRIEKAINSGSAVFTSIDEKLAGSPLLKGLVDNHAYMISAAIKVPFRQNTEMLLRIRNPWGEKGYAEAASCNGEWTGRWSYRSKEWKEVGDSVRGEYNVDYTKGGEFWVCMDDFYKIFEHVYIADTIPHFDEDGFRKEDNLNKVLNIFGEWHGETAAGDDRAKKFRNPRFVLEVSNRDLKKNQQMPVLLQFVQQYDAPLNRNEKKDQKTTHFCRLDVFRMVKEEVINNRLHVCLLGITKDEIHRGGREIAYRYRLSAGKYLLVPNYRETYAKHPVSRPFCIRVFASTNVQCSAMAENPLAMVGSICETLENSDGTLKTTAHEAQLMNIFGEWKNQTAAGSDEGKRLQNPKYILTIPENRKQKVFFQLIRSAEVQKTIFFRLDIFEIDFEVKRENKRWMVLRQITINTTFIGSEIASYEYELKPGKYMLLPNYNDKDQFNCEFCIRILSTDQFDCSMLNEMPVAFVWKTDQVLEYQNQLHTLDKTEHLFGEWIKDRTAGGQISNASFIRNPQYELSVGGSSNQPVMISLLQETVEPIHAISCYVIQISKDEQFPVQKERFRGDKINTVEGKPHRFVYSCDVSGFYAFKPGQYVIAVCADKPTDEKKFALLVASTPQAKLSLKALQ